MHVKLSSMPDPKELSSVRLKNLSGGLNLSVEPDECGSRQSPDLLNLCYRDGALRTRPGLRQLIPGDGDYAEASGRVCFYGRLFHGFVVYACGTSIRYFCPAEEAGAAEAPTVQELPDCIPKGTGRGSWFPFGEALYYKARGIYLALTLTACGTLQVSTLLRDRGDGSCTVGSDVYTPVITISRSADGSAGTAYQPENRINPQKTVWFDVDAVSTDYILPVSGAEPVSILLDDEAAERNGTAFTFPGLGLTGQVLYGSGAEDSGSNTLLRFDRPICTAEDDESGESESETTTPADRSNRLRVTYRLDNLQALWAIADCRCAVDYGGSDSVCVVMGGCSAQPNAIFWSGNGSAGVDPTYFPMEQYNLVGTCQDPITALSKYSSYLIVLQPHSCSRAGYAVETDAATGRDRIDLTLATINPERGCDLPWSVQLAGNNLVWAHTRHGVYYLSATSAAYENSVRAISRNVDGSARRPGLLADLQAASADCVCSMDDGSRYYLKAGDYLWVWDHSLSAVSDGVSGLSWWRHSGIPAESMTCADTTVTYLLDGQGCVRCFDEEAPVDFSAHWQSPTQTFGGLYRKKHFRQLNLELDTRQGATVTVKAACERTATASAEQRLSDAGGLTRPVAHLQLEPRAFHTGLALRLRAPNISHFSLRLETEGDLAIFSATMYYTAQGVAR